jgi:hypothetical protein
MALSNASVVGTLGVIDVYPAGRIHIFEVQFESDAAASSPVEPLIAATGLNFGGASSRAVMVQYNDAGNANLNENGGAEGIYPTLDVANQNLEYRNTVTDREHFAVGWGGS